MYYGVGEDGSQTSAIDPCDINGAHFKPDTYLEKTFKEKSLSELMDKEGDITKRMTCIIKMEVLGKEGKRFLPSFPHPSPLMH